MARILDWTRRLEAEGSDPDPRFSFANERTFLAWIRTSLALIAAGIGVEALVTTVPEWGRRTLAGFLVLLGGVLAAFAFRRWCRPRPRVLLRQRPPVPGVVPDLAVPERGGHRRRSPRHDRPGVGSAHAGGVPRAPRRRAGRLRVPAVAPLRARAAALHLAADEPAGAGDRLRAQRRRRARHRADPHRLMSSPDSPGWDPGLQNERTTLAWVRTALSFVAAGTLAGKQTGAGVTFRAA